MAAALMRPTYSHRMSTQKGIIEIVVPTNYLNGYLKIIIEYEIMPLGQSNRVNERILTTYIQYLDDPERACPVAGCFDSTVIGEITNALRYAEFVNRWLSKENKKTPPSSYEEWQAHFSRK